MSAAQLPLTNLREWIRLRPELVFIFDEPVPAKWANGRGERNNEFSAWLVRRGWARVTVDGKMCHCPAGNWLICFGRNIEQEFSSDAHLLSLRVAQYWPDEQPLFSGPPLHVVPASRHPQLEKLALPILKSVRPRVAWKTHEEIDPRRAFLWSSAMDYFDFIDLEVRMLRWLKELAGALVKEGRSMRVSGNHDERLARAFHLLDSAAPADRFPKEALVRTAGLTLDRLNHLSVQTYGYTLHKYWEQRRMAWASRLLQLPGNRIKEVSLQLGFIELPHFSAWFKRQTGLSPRQWRTQLLRGKKVPGRKLTGKPAVKSVPRKAYSPKRTRGG